MKIEEISALCMVIAVVSFLGFVVENLWLSVVRGYMDNRNMCLPFLLVGLFELAITYYSICFYSNRDGITPCSVIQQDF